MKNNNIILFDQFDLGDCLECIRQWLMSTVGLVKITTSAILDKKIPKSEIQELTQECRKNWIECYIWWWITYRSIKKSQLTGHIKYLHDLWISTIEIPDSVGNNKDPELIFDLVEKLSLEFDKVLIEIWSKEKDIFSMDYAVWEKSIIATVNAWADWIIIEWWMWDVWIYDDKYKIKTLLLWFILKKISDMWYDKDIIIEANNPDSQEYIINLFWPWTKLWNICMDDTNLDNINSTRNSCKKNENLLLNFYELIDTIFKFCNDNWINPNYFFFNPKYYNLDPNIKKSILLLKHEILSLTPESSNSWIIIPSNPEMYLRSMLVKM